MVTLPAGYVWTTDWLGYRTLASTRSEARVYLIAPAPFRHSLAVLEVMDDGSIRRLPGTYGSVCAAQAAAERRLVRSLDTAG